LTNAKRTVLANGITLITLENRRLPIVVASAAIRDARLHEPAEKAGVASLVGDLLEEGSAKHTGEEIATLIENVGGTLAFTGSGGSVKTLTPHAPLGLRLLFDSLMAPAFPADRFGAKKEQLLGNIAAHEVEPTKKAVALFLKAIYGEHPYSRTAEGTMATAETLTVADCRAFHAKVFVPNNTTVVVVGDFDTAAMAKQIEELTKDWKAVELEKPVVPAPPVPAKKTTIVTDKNAAQTHVLIGHLGITRNNSDYYKLLVLDNVFGTGSGFTDRLSSTLRDRQGLAYSVSAVITEDAGTEPGTFTGSIGTFPEKFTWVRDGFLKELNKIRTDAPTDAEVDGAKQFLLGSMPFRLRTNAQVAGELLNAERYGLGFDTFEKFRTAVAAVTPADVLAVAQKHLVPDKLVVVAVGPIDDQGNPLKPAKKGGKP
jgi:zinc protease